MHAARAAERSPRPSRSLHLRVERLVFIVVVVVVAETSQRPDELEVECEHPDITWRVCPNLVGFIVEFILLKIGQNS